MALLFKLRVAAVVLIAAALPAANAGDRFRVLGAESAASLERRLQAAAAEGYRMRAAARGTSVSGKGRAAVLMEAATGAPVAYAVVTTSGDLTEGASARQLGELAREGYRLSAAGVLADTPDDWWVPTGDYADQVWLVLERERAGASYAYASFGFETEERFARDIATWVEQGYAAIGVVNSARRLRILLERDLASPAAEAETPRTAPGRRYRMLIGSRKLGVRFGLNDASAQGYRLVGVADASTLAPPMMLVEKSVARIEEHRYRTLYEPGVKIYKDKLERKLNKRARKGLRVVPGGVTSEVVVLEETDTPVEYRTLSSKDRTPLPDQLAAATDDGFDVVTMFVNGDETTVVIERPVP